jgi:hypothetical protein
MSLNKADPVVVTYILFTRSTHNDIHSETQHLYLDSIYTQCHSMKEKLDMIYG